MNRRQFGKAALGVAAATWVTPSALASTPRTIVDCLVIDYEKSRKRWRKLEEPDEAGHTFVYEDSSHKDKYRHFELLGSDGLVVGQSTLKQSWTATYDAFEQAFLTFYLAPNGKRFSRSEFKRYADDVRYELDGHFVEIQDLDS